MKQQELAPVLKFCRNHAVELNVDAAGSISLYASVSSNDFCLVDVDPQDIKKAIFALEVFRKQGWKSN